MTTLVFTNESGTVRVVYKTDLLSVSEDRDSFTVMTIEGLDDAEVVLGFSFQQLPYTIVEFKAFADDHNLLLTAFPQGGDSVVLADHDSSSS